MRLLFLLVRIPTFPFLFFRIVLPLWNWFWSNAQAAWYTLKGERAEAKRELRAWQESLNSTIELSRRYVEVGFRWNADPMGGYLDFSSKAWVSIAKNSGDCDDMMVIAEAVLRNKYNKGHRGYVFRDDGAAHAVYILEDDGTCHLMSNQRSLGTFTTLEGAVNRTYGDRTRYTYVY